MLSASRRPGWRELVFGACAAWLIVQNVALAALLACGRPAGAAGLTALARAVLPVLVPLWVTAATMLVCVTAVVYAARGRTGHDA